MSERPRPPTTADTALGSIHSTIPAARRRSSWDRPTIRSSSTCGCSIFVPGTKTFTFGYDLAAGTFALVAQIGDSTAQTFWLEGGADSEAVSLIEPPPPPTFTQVARSYLL